METLKSGSPAYVDTFSGMIPCRVLTISGRSGVASSDQDVEVVLTASRGPYRKGETLKWRGYRVVPRKAVRFHKYGTKIRAYMVQADSDH
jgi:hypothetical protein